MKDKKGTNYFLHLLKVLVFLGLMGLVMAVIGYQFSNTLTETSFPGVVFGTEIEVSSRTQAKILEIEVDQNRPVRKGQVLVELYDEEIASQIKAGSDELVELELAVERAKKDPMLESQEFQTREKMAELQAELNSSEITLPNIESEIQSASTALLVHQDQVARAQKLFDGGAMLITELEARKLTLSQSLQALQTLKGQLEQEKIKRLNLSERIGFYRQQLDILKEKNSKTITDLEISLRQKKGELNTLLALRSELILHSPQDGIVSKILKSVGEIASAGEPILNIYTGERLWVEVYPSAQNSALLNPGDRMQIFLDTSGLQRLNARVQGVLPVMQSQTTTSFLGSSDTSYAVVMVEFEDLEKAKTAVKKGQNVTAVLVP